MILKVGLVTHEHHRKFVPIFDPQDFPMKPSDVLERPPLSQGEDEQEALARPHVLLPHGRELLLARGVEDVQLGHLVVYDALLLIRVLDGGVVIGDKVALLIIP